MSGSSLPAMRDWPSLSGLELFQGLERPGIEAICARGRLDHAARETLIFEQGARAQRAYALVAGSVRIVQTGQDGGQSIMRFIVPGEMFGTVPLFTDHLFPGDAVATAPSRILSWSEDVFLEIIGRHPRIALNVVRIIGTRLAEIQNRMRELATQRSGQRIAHTLLRLAAKAGHSAHGGETINLPVRRKDIAEASGTTLYTASRTLSAWKKAGLLAAHHQHIVILDPAAVRRIARNGDLEPCLRKRKGAAASRV